MGVNAKAGLGGSAVGVGINKSAVGANVGTEVGNIIDSTAGAELLPL